MRVALEPSMRTVPLLIGLLLTLTVQSLLSDIRAVTIHLFHLYWRRTALQRRAYSTRSHAIGQCPTLSPSSDPSNVLFLSGPGLVASRAVATEAVGEKASHPSPDRG